MYCRIIPFLFLILTACTPRLIPASDPTQISPFMPTPVSSPIPQEFMRLKMIELAALDLSARLSTNPEFVNVISAEATLWPDSSLGCPQPNETYAQVQTEGYLVRLEANGQIYEYHTDTNVQFAQCNSSSREHNKNIEDGWPSETKDNDVIITTPTK